MKSIAIYMAGSIQKGHEKGNELFWHETHFQELRNLLKDRTISFLNPAFRTDDLSDQLSVFGRDMTQIFCSDVVLVDARDRRGLGVGAEMMWAKVRAIPVITWAPLETHYHKSETTLLGVRVSNFIHPFVDALSDVIVSTLSDAAIAIEKVLKDQQYKVKDINCVTAAMEHYLAKGFSSDMPMQKIVDTHFAVKEKIESFTALK
jgi:hypothetical protein